MGARCTAVEHLGCTLADFGHRNACDPAEYWLLEQARNSGSQESIAVMHLAESRQQDVSEPRLIAPVSNLRESVSRQHRDATFDPCFQHGTHQTVGGHNMALRCHDVSGGASDPISPRQGRECLLRPGNYSKHPGSDEVRSFFRGKEQILNHQRTQILSRERTVMQKLSPLGRVTARMIVV